MKLFSDQSKEQQSNSLASFFPAGSAFESVNLEDSVLENFIEGLSCEIKRVYDDMNDLSEDYDILVTDELLSKWESAVGIPDDCFLGNGDKAERRLHVLLKFAKMNVQTASEFQELAVLLGFSDATVTPLNAAAFPPYDVPFIPISAPDSRYTIVVRGANVVSGVPPYDVPFTPSSNNQSILSCIFDIVKPANVQIIYVNTQFSPTSLENNVLWDDASDVSFITESSGSASQWNDKSGIGNNSTQGTGSAQPTTGTDTINGKNALDFDGTSDFMSLDSDLSLVDDWSIFIVSNTDDTTSVRMLLGDDTNNSKIGINASGNLFVRADNLGSSDETLAFASGNSILYISKDASDKVDAAFNGGSLNRLFADVAQTGTSIFGRIGVDDSANFWDGNIAEIIVYDRALSASERAEVESDLTPKWGI